MDTLANFLLKFCIQEKFTTILLILISCILNILKINLLSNITANIIKSIYNDNLNSIYDYYKYFIIVSIIFIIIFYIYKNIQTAYLSKLRHWIRHTIIKYLLESNNEDYINKNYVLLGASIYRISNNCFYFFNHLINNLIPNLTLILIISIYFIYNNSIFGIIFLLGNILIISYLSLFWNELTISNDTYEESIIDNESACSEVLSNFDKIIYRGEIHNELNELYNNSKNVINKANIFYKKTIKHSSIINIIIFLLLFILIYYLIHLYIHKEIDSTLFVTFLTILLLYKDILLNSTNEIADYIEFIGRGKLLNIVFEDIPININKIDNDPLENKKYNMDFNTILFENINFKYKNHKKKILNNFNLKIEADNKIIGITGISGIGKSTFVKLLVKMYKYEGNIYIDGININKIDSIYIRQNIVYVSQDPKLFDKIVIDNLFYACNNKQQCIIYLEEIMKFQKIKELFEKINLNKKSIKAGDNLSGGQKQVINIINGLISDSKILILDEPTNSLDKALKNEIIDLIMYFKKYKKCIIIISHDSDIFPYFDQNIVINSITNEEN